MDVSLLARTEDQKAKSTAAWWPVLTFRGVCEWMVINGIFCFIDWSDGSPLEIKLLTPSQAAVGLALLRVMLCFGVAAAAAAAAALWQPVGRRIRLDLARVAMACTAATHGIKIWLLFFVGRTSQQESPLLLSFLFAVAVVVFTVVDLLVVVAINRGDGAEERRSRAAPAAAV